MKKLLLGLTILGTVSSFATEISRVQMSCNDIDSAKMRLSSPYSPNSIGYEEYGESVDFDEPIKELRAMGYVSVDQSQKSAVINLDYNVEIEFERKLKHSFTNGKLNLNGAFQFTDMYSDTNKWDAHLLETKENLTSYFTVTDKRGSCALFDCLNNYYGYDIQIFTVKKDEIKLEKSYLSFNGHKNFLSKPSIDEVRNMILKGKTEKVNFEAVFKGCN